jgi:hypothetical protein
MADIQTPDQTDEQKRRILASQPLVSPRLNIPQINAIPPAPAIPQEQGNVPGFGPSGPAFTFGANLQKPQQSVWQKMEHGLGRAANIAGDVLAPAETALIPGSDLYKQREQGREARLGEAAARTGQMKEATAASQAARELTPWTPLGETEPTMVPFKSLGQLEAGKQRGEAAEEAAGTRAGAALGAAESRLQGTQDTNKTKLQIALESAGLGKLPPEIAAQVGMPPDPTKFPQGKADPGYGKALADWGKNAEAIKVQEAGAQGQMRGQAYGEYRPVQVYNPASGNYEWQFAKQAIAEGASPAGLAQTTMGKQAQFSEMHTAIDKLGAAIDNLDRPLDAEQIGKLTFAIRHTDDPTVLQNEIESFLGTQQLTPSQQDLVVWMSQIAERAMSLRNVAGMGQGSDQLRAAIVNTLPSVKSGNTEMMHKQLAAFQNQVNLLERGIGGVKGSVARGNQPTEGATVTVKAGGKTFTFPNQKAADDFKKEAGIE